MRVHVITLFPEQIETFLSVGILGRATAAGLLEVKILHLRDFALDRHKTVDDYPYGGGEGLILKAEPMARAIINARENCDLKNKTDVPVVLTSPQGRPLNAAVAREYSLAPEWIVVCGHYGGVDQRIADMFVTDEISLGDFVLTGGELPALALIEAAARFVPGVLGNEDSAKNDTFEDGLLGAPRYTRPPVFEGMEVPEILLSGHHAAISRWKRNRKLELTYRRRPELLEKAVLDEEDRRFLDEIKTGGGDVE